MGHGTATFEASIRNMGLPLIGGGNEGVELGGCWGISHEKVEYSRAVYFDATNYGPLWGGIVEAGGARLKKVVVTGWFGIGGGAGGVSAGGGPYVADGVVVGG